MKKSVLITGGSRGIGAAAVREFSRKGYDVAFFYLRSDEEAKKVSDETGAVCIKCDVSDIAQVKESVKAARTYLGVSAFDAVVCNAGISGNGVFIDMDYEKIEEILKVNLMGAINVTKEALPQMIARKSGSIVLVSSVWGQTGASCEAAYSAAKAGLFGLAGSLAKEVGPSGIRVNTVAPGVIDTDMNSCHSKETMEALREEIPLGRIGSPEEVAKAIAFLASEDASYITGQVIAVNGGFYI